MVKLTKTGQILANALEEQVFKAGGGNPNHDDKGRFSSGGDSGSASGDNTSKGAYDEKAFSKKWDDLTAKHQSEIKALGDKHAVERQALKAPTERERIQARSKLIDKHQNEINDMAHQHYDEIKALDAEELKARNSDQKLADLKAQRDAEVNAQTANHEQQTKALDDQIKKLQDQRTAFRAQHAKERSDLQSKHQKLFKDAGYNYQ